MRMFSPGAGHPQVPRLAMLLAIMLFTNPISAFAQDLGSLWFSVTTEDDALKGVPTMVSCVMDGAIVFQKEVLTSVTGEDGGRCLSPGEGELIAVGTYDVRFEGAGMITEVKRGVQVVSDRRTHLRAIMSPGEGVHVVEYAEGGLAREEVARRLRELEQKTADLEARLADLEEEPDE